ncbi:MAG TPA: RpiB/LacA/LacB family sugar-phosphate isomerase [Tepidisphaeraceae bacterium]|jgi:ribose 5-phosphate isomerase RpiB
MIFTARQLEEMYRGCNGKIVLPYRARLTPLAQDWLRQKKVEVGYADGDASTMAQPAAASAKPNDAVGGHSQKVSGANWLWWCDGPCGPAKAAVMTMAREANFVATEIGVDQKRLVDAIKLIAGDIKAGNVNGGFLLVNNGAAAMVYANRCPSIRAVVGTCIEAVDQGVRGVAANVLVIEHPYKTLQQVKTLLAHFVRGKRELSEEVARQLSELSTCA